MTRVQPPLGGVGGCERRKCRPGRQGDIVQAPCVSSCDLGGYCKRQAPLQGSLQPRVRTVNKGGGVCCGWVLLGHGTCPSPLLDYFSRCGGAGALQLASCGMVASGAEAFRFLCPPMSF